MATEGNIPEDVSATNLKECFPAESIKPSSGLSQYSQCSESSAEVENKEREDYDMIRSPEDQSSVESYSHEKLPTENISKSEPCEADKMENQAQTEITENEKQHQKGVLSKDVETRDDKVEAINDINIEETDHDKEDDGAKIPRPACAEELNPKVHEEESSVDNSFLDQHLERITDQHASLKVIPESIVNEENTRSKGEEVAALECNEQATSESETNLDLVNEAILPNLDLKTKSQGEENERVIGSYTKDEDTETTIHVEDEIKEIYLTGVQNKKADMPSVPEGEWKDPESIGSSNKLEHDNNREEDAYTVNVAQNPHVHHVEEFTFEASVENGENDNDNSEEQDGGKKDSWQKNELEDEDREQIILIPEETEIAASRENAEKRVEQNKHPVENFEEKEEKDGGETSISTDKSLPLAESIEEIKSEKSIFPPKNANDLNSEGPLVEETVQPDRGEIGIVSKTEAEEKHQESSKFCTENNEQDEHCSETQSTENLNIKHTDSETITRSTMDIEEHEKVPESNSEEKIGIKVDEKIVPEEPKEMEEATNKQSHETAKESASDDETPSRISIAALISDETIDQSIGEESVKDGESTLVEKNDSHKPEDAEEEKQLICDETITALISDEIIEQSIEEESLKDGQSTLTEKNDSHKPEDDEEEKNTAEAIDLPKSTGGQETGKKQIIEGSVDETKNNFEDSENEIQCSRDDTSREFKEENYVMDLPPEFIQNTELEEKHSTIIQLDSNQKECSLTESETSVESSSAHKSPTENICRAEHSLADKTENKELTETSENERQNKMGLQIKDVETGGDKVEVINDINIEEPDMKTKSQGEEDERERDSSIKDEDTNSTKHVEDEFNEICLSGEQNKEAEMPSALEGERKKDPEPIGSNDNLEHENNREEDASAENVAQSPCVRRVEDSPFEASSRNGDNDDDKSESESSNLDTDRGSTKVAIEAGVNLQEASYTAEKDKNEDIYESEWQQNDVCPVDKKAEKDDLACLNRDVREAHEEGLTETNEVGKINPESQEWENKDSRHKNEQEVELGEQVILIPEKTEIAAPRADAKNGVEQNIQLTEKFEETEHTEKSLPLAESIIEIKSEERIFPPTIASDLNSEGPLIEETGQPDSGETGEVSKTEVEDKHQESNEFFIENNEQDDHFSEKQSIENLAIKHTDLEATVTTETITKSTKDAEELQKVSESLSEEKIDIKDEEKIIPEEPKETEGATYKQSQETAKESASEDESSSLPTTALISDEMIEQSIEEESLMDGESTLVEKNDSHKQENDAEEKKKDPEAFDQPKSTCGQETRKQQIMERSVEQTKNHFEDNEKEIQCSRDDTGREVKEENHVTDLPPEFIQDTGPEERYPTAVQLDSNLKECLPAESEGSVESFSAEKSPTENISRPEHFLADKEENEELTEISENESKNQEGLQIKDDEKEGDKVEAIIDKNIEEPDHDIENDSAKISMLTFAEEPNLKVHEEETSTEISFIDQHLELTDQEASFKVIPESVVKDENTTSKGEEDTVLEYNLQATGISKTNLGLVNEALLPNLDLKTKSQGEEDERDIESGTKDEHIICLTGEQNKEAEMPSVLEGEWKKDPKPNGSSYNLELENNREEDACTENVAQSPCVQRVEESNFEAASRNGDNDDDKSEDKSSNQVTDGGSTDDKDKNNDIHESECQQTDVHPVDKMAKAEDLACLNRDVRGAHEEGRAETNEVDKINPERNEGEKRDLWHKNEQDVELEEHVILISEKTEIAARKENAENGVEQNIQLIEEKDEPTSTHDTGETSISTEKRLPLAESITEIESEERIFPQKIENDSNPEGPLVQEIGQPEIGEIGEVSKTEAEEKHRESSKICTENKQDEHCSGTQSTDNLEVKHTVLEAMVTTETITTSLKDAEELEQVLESPYEKNKDIKGDEKVIPEAPKETEEATDKQSHETAKESSPEDEDLARLSTASLIRDETIEQRIEEESLKDTESTLIEKNDSDRPENTAEENIKAVEAFDLPKDTDGLDICKQQIREGSVDETMNNFKDNEKEIQSSREDTDREMKEENYVPDLPPEFIQNTELEERYLSIVQLDSNTKECSTAEPESSVDLSSHDQSPTEYICPSEHCQADKIENEELTGISENERQNQNGVLSKDEETGGDKVKVINDTNIEEPGHDIKNDVAKSSLLTCAEQSNLKVQEEETSIENSSLDRHLELITDQFPESIEKDKNTRSKGEGDAVLESNEQVTSTSEINLCKINEASISNLDLTTKSQGEEDEREKESCTKDEDIDTTIHVDDEFKEISLTGAQNKKAEIPPVLEFEWKESEYISSSSKLEHDNNKEEDASFHRVEEHTFEIASRNGDNDDDKSENQSFNLVADETSTQVTIEAGETLQEASYTACKDKNKDVFESVRQEIDVLPVEDSACLNRDVRAAKEDDIIQMGLTQTYENDKTNPAKHDEEKRDSWQKNEQEDELGEQVILIPEKTEIAAPIDNAEKIVHQGVHPAENFDEKEEKDEPTSTPDTRETSIPTEKSLPLVEPVTMTKSEELNSKYLLVEEAGQPDSDETGEVSKTDAEETHQEPGKFSTENNKQDELHSETQSKENFAVKPMDSEAKMTTETITKSTKDTEELEKVTESHSEDKIDIKGDEKITPEEPKDMEEVTDNQSHETATESVSEDEAPSRLSIEESIRNETVEQSFQEESLRGELTFIEESHREIDAEENIKAIKAFDQSKTTGGQDTSKQQIIEGSLEEKMNNFQENEKEIQSSMEDTGREIIGMSCIPDLPPEFNKKAELGEKYLMTAQLDSNPNECSSAESKSSVEPSSPDISPTENIHTSEHFQADKIENQPLTNLSEHESQHQNGAACKDVETGSDKVEAIIEQNIEQDHDHRIENDGAKIQQLACAEKTNPKVHEEESSIDNTSLDWHLELITDQLATSKVIAERMEKEMITPHTNENTRSKREENADLECNEQATSISKTNLGLVNEALLPNLDLKTKSQGEETDRVIESCTKVENTDATINAEDEFNEISLAGVENKKVEILSVSEDEGKDPESIRSSDRLEHEDDREEDASTENAAQGPFTHKVEESTIEAVSRNRNEDDDNSAIPSSNLITDGTNTPVEIDTTETLQEPSHTACRDKNKDIHESAWDEVDIPPVDRMAKAEDSACLRKGVRGANEEDIIQTGLIESNEDSKIDTEKRDGEKIDTRQNNEEENELEEQVTLIPEKTEIASQTEDAEKGVEEKIHPGENSDEKEEKDKLTSTPVIGETSISTEKSFPPVESITKIKSEERTFPQINVNDLNSKDPLIEGTGQSDSGEISEVVKTEAKEKHQESSKFSTENNKQDEHCSETQSTENLVIKHTDSEAMMTTEIITKSSKDAEEPERVPESHSEEKKDIKSDEKIIPEEPKEMDKATDILSVETETPLITHTEGASILGSSDNDKEKEMEYSNEGIQKQKDGGQPMPPDLKTENISESDTGYIIEGKREQVDGLADQNEVCKTETVEDEKSMTEVTKNIEVYTSMNSRKALLQEEEPSDETEDSLAVTGVEREAEELKAASLSSEEFVNTKASELLMEKGASVSVTQDQSENTLLHSQSVQQVIKLRFQDDIESNMKDKELSNLPLDQDEDTKDIEFTQEVHQRLGTANNDDNINEHPTEDRITSPEEETGNEVEVSTSEFTEHIESTNLTEEKKPVTLEDHTEQNIDITDFSALKFMLESETCTEVSSSTSKVYEKETEVGFIKRDDPTSGDPKNVPAVDEIEEMDLKKAESGHVEHDKGSDIAIESKGETEIATNETTSNHIDNTERKEENSKPEKKGILEELNGGHLMIDSCVEETDKTTTVQDERELATSSIPISQDYPKQLVEEKDAMHNAEGYLVHSSENTSLQKEHEVVKLGDVSELESVEITNECSNEDISKLENEGLHMVSDQKTNNSISDTTNVALHDDTCKLHTGKEEKFLIEASKCTASSTYKDNEAMQGQENLATSFEGSLTSVAKEKAATASETKDFSHENEPTDEFPPEKTVEAADTSEEVELASKPTAKDQSDEKIYEAEEESNSEDHVFESTESEQIKEAMASEEAANLRTIEKTFEFVPELHSYEELMESEEKEKHIKRALTNMHPEENQSEMTIAAGKTINTQVSDEKIKEEQEAAKDFQQIYVAERDRTRDQETEQNAVEYPIKKTNETLQTSSNDNQHEVKSEAIEEIVYENIKDNLPKDKEGKNVTEAAKSVAHENQGTETKITGGRTEVVAPGEKESGVTVDSSHKGHMDTTEVCECTREEIQKLEESSWEKVDINLTEKADVETRKINDEGVQHWPQEAEEPLQVDIHLDDEATAKIDSEKEDGEDENQKLEPLSGASSAMVETSKDKEVKVAHKKSHNILSGVGSKVKHSISKVKKAITGKSSHPKTPSPK